MKTKRKARYCIELEDEKPRRGERYALLMSKQDSSKPYISNHLSATIYCVRTYKKKHHFDELNIREYYGECKTSWQRYLFQGSWQVGEIIRG